MENQAIALFENNGERVVVTQGYNSLTFTDSDKNIKISYENLKEITAFLTNHFLLNQK